MPFSPEVRVAGGPAMTGSGGQRVTFPPLLVDVHDVSDQQYRYCVQAQQCAPPDEPASDAHYAEGDRVLPVVYVTAYDAVQFCSWLGRRLPTEPEWEWIARGPNGNLYPWGNAPPRLGQVNAIVGHHLPTSLVPADSTTFSGGDSPDGIEQLIGNVEEWTATQAYNNDNGGVVPQGNWNGHDPVNGLAVAGSGYEDPAVRLPDALTIGDPSGDGEQTGFRCVATP